MFLLVSAVLILSTGCSRPMDYQDTELTVLFTIDADTKLAIVKPKTFKVIDDVSYFMSNQSPIIEFIPNHETKDQWSIIFTGIKFIGSGMQNIIYDAYLANKIAQHASHVKTLQHTTKKYKNYTQSTLIISYILNNKREILIAISYANKHDLVGFQLTIRPPEIMSIKESVASMKNFLLENSYLLVKTTHDTNKKWKKISPALTIQ